MALYNIRLRSFHSGNDCEGLKVNNSFVFKSVSNKMLQKQALVLVFIIHLA
jgi:hypothetical protein